MATILKEANFGRLAEHSKICGSPVGPIFIALMRSCGIT